MRSGTIRSHDAVDARFADARRGVDGNAAAPDRLPRISGNAETGACDNRHAVVIGSGFGGLAAAVRLGAMGYRVTVVERLAEAGGRA
ncbi:MAG TPA: NAD(P)-binding protein, partial [Woeseiaceae bacterium]